MIQNDIEVKYVKPNFVLYRTDRSSQSSPSTNDPQFSDQWALQKSSASNGGIDAVSAWKISTGSPSIVIGVIDSGINYEHDDLDSNVWNAPWDFTLRVGGQDITCRKNDHGFNAPAKSCNPTDQNYHGTRVSGIIGAEGNNQLDVAGVNWTTSIMGLRHIDEYGNTNEKDIVNSVEFAVAAKRQSGLANIRVLNNSYGYQTTLNEICYPDPLADAVRLTYDADILFVASAGNDKSNNDVEPFYPANLTIPNVISVGGTTSKDKVYSKSNWGLKTVHLGAPAASIVSTNPSGHDTGSGTSYGAPFVAGSAALILSKCPTLDAVHLKSCILANADEVKSLEKYFPQGRRLNVNNAIQNCGRCAP